MLRIFAFIAILFITLTANNIIAGKSRLPDGLYLVIRIDEDSTAAPVLAENEAALAFSPLFEEFNGEEHVRIIVDKNEYVPIVLESLPLKEKQTDNKKKLLLTLSKSASDKLKSFSEKHLNQTVAIVVGGKVLTKHQIKAVLTEGKLQITRCTDNACELLYDVLKNQMEK